MNLKLKMKDIDKILAKAHFKCNLFLNDAKKQIIFAEHVSMKLLDKSIRMLQTVMFLRKFIEKTA
jgi:hypothetical protein